MTKRFTTNGYYINDTYHDGRKWLVNEVEAEEIVDVMNNLDMKARERSKALSKLQKTIDEQQATINLLLDLLYQSEETVINEYSSHIGEDMDKLDKIFKEKDIKEIERFVRGCDDE